MVVKETESQFWNRKLGTFFWRRVSLEKETRNKETQSELRFNEKGNQTGQELIAEDETANRR